MIIYHYCSTGALLGLIKGKAIWASKIQHMNDEKEYVQYIEIFNKHAKELFRNGDEEEKSFLDNVLMTTESLTWANIFTASFTENGDLLSQWRGYCPSGGYSVGFELDELREFFQSQGLRFEKVSYSPPNAEDIKVLIEQSYRNFRKNYKKDPLSDHSYSLEPIVKNIITEAPKFKHDGFKEEQEWRLISNLIDARNDKIDVVDIRGRLRPIYKADFSALGKEVTFKKIYVSPGHDYKLRREGLTFLLQVGKSHCTNIERSNIPYTTR